MPLDPPGVSLPLSLRPGSPGLSDPVRELMGRPPHWLLRSGAAILGWAILLLLVLGALINYPDMIVSRLTVTGTYSVVEVVARQSGHLQAVKVKEKEMVRQGDVLAVIESPCDAETALGIRRQLDKLTGMLTSDEAFVRETFPSEPKLGRLQDSYSVFLAAYTRLLVVWNDEHTTKTAGLLAGQLTSKLNQVQNMKGQQSAMDQELVLAKEKYARMKALFSRGSISAGQLKEHETVLLTQTREHASVEKNLLEEQILASRLEKEIRDLNHERNEVMQAMRDRFRTAYQKLCGDIDIWEGDYVLKAPADGMVAFYDFWSEQQYVTAGRQVFIIVPETSSLRGRMTISQGGAGKIKPGQLVRIKFDDYPSRTFGIVTGRVNSLSLVAREGSNQVLVDLDYPLVSSYHKPLHFKQEMAGEASIVTENASLLGRIFYEIRKAFYQNSDL
jgi:multidrug resistance efflux pump